MIAMRSTRVICPRARGCLRGLLKDINWKWVTVYSGNKRFWTDHR